MNDRLESIRIIVFILFLPLFLSLYYLQVFKGKYYFKRSMDNIIRVVPDQGMRGEIFDAEGKKIVGNYPSFNVVVIPQEFKKDDKIFQKLGEYFSISDEVLKKRYKSRYSVPFAPVNLIEDLPKDLALKFEMENSFPGVFVRVQPERVYNYGKVCSHVLGFLGKIDNSQLKFLKKYGYSSTDYIGKFGLERYFDSYLRGEAGGKLLEVDSRGRQIDIIGLKPSVKGKDIKLTIDISLQEYIDSLFRKI